jgi:hypothetical protein
MARSKPPVEGVSPLEAVSSAHRAFFGTAPAIQGLAGIGRDLELMELIRAAIRAGETFDGLAVAKAWGCTIPPPSRLETAIASHRGRFRFAPGVGNLEGKGRDDELAALIEAAVLTSKPFDSEATAQAWGLGELPAPE